MFWHCFFCDMLSAVYYTKIVMNYYINKKDDTYVLRCVDGNDGE
jgi:hypothetical protein